MTNLIILVQEKNHSLMHARKQLLDYAHEVATLEVDLSLLLQQIEYVHREDTKNLIKKGTF